MRGVANQECSYRLVLNPGPCSPHESLFWRTVSDLASPDGFMVELEGSPEIEGDAAVKLGFGANMKYSFATSETSISVAMPGERLTIRFSKTGMACQNVGDANVETCRF